MPRVTTASFGGGDFRVRMRQIRVARRWDQPELANHAGYSSSLISGIETGKVLPSPDQISAISEALGYSVDFMTAPLRTGPATRPWLRSYADASKRETDARRAMASLSGEYIRSLNLRLLPDLIPDFSGDLDDPDAIEDAALDLREMAGLEPGAVVGNVVRAAERVGCVVLPFESELGRHLGMSVRVDGIPMVCVAKGGIPGDRQRFTVAHELGHLVLHAAAPPPASSAQASTMERQAHRFAAAFLTPGEAVLETLDDVSRGRVTLAVLAEVKSVWGVAIRSLVGRFKELGRIDADQAQSLYKQISSRGWNRAEPVEVGIEQAQWFPAQIRLRGGADDLRAAAATCTEQIGGATKDLWAMVDWTYQEATIHRLTARR